MLHLCLIETLQLVARYFRNIKRRMYSVLCQWDVSPSGWVKFRIWDPQSRFWMCLIYLLHLLVSGIAKRRAIIKKYVQSYKERRVSKTYFINNFPLSKCSEIWTLSDKWMLGETQGRWELRVDKLLPMRANHCKTATHVTEEKHYARGGLVTRMKVIGQRKHDTVHYTVKRKVCAGLKPTWLVQVWKERYLESIVLDLRVRTYPSISAFTQKDWKPTDVVS